MRVLDTEISGVKIIEPLVFKDDRGYFFESYNASQFEKSVGFRPNFCQSNESGSSKGTIRGLHLQKAPFAQSKLVRVVNGSALDVVVDCRLHSPTYGVHLTVELDASNKRQVWIPQGCAHGFQVISEYCILSYKVDAPYHYNSEVSINPFDKYLGIKWYELSGVNISEKDKSGIEFTDFSD